MKNHKDKVKERLLFNRAIIKKLSELINEYPEQRFGQLLINCDILQCVMEGNTVFIRDCFNEEPEDIWKRMCKNTMCFKQNKEN